MSESSSKPRRHHTSLLAANGEGLHHHELLCQTCCKHTCKKTHKATFSQPGLVHFHLTLFMWVHIRWVQNQFSVVIGKTKLCLCFIYRFTLTHVLEHFLERMVHVHCTALVWDGLCNTVYTCLPVMFFLNTKQTTRLTVWLSFKCGLNPGSMSMIVTQREEEDSLIASLRLWQFVYFQSWFIFSNQVIIWFSSRKQCLSQCPGQFKIIHKAKERRPGTFKKVML